jgi:hypothetical protein
MYKDDEKWVTKQITKISDLGLRVKVWQAYKKAFDEAFETEPLEHRKENKARFAANNRLRLFIEKQGVQQ